MEIPRGNSREEVRMRDQIIKDFYAGWIAENPEKKMWNEDLQDYILVKYLSITETAEKAARQYESTLAVMRLSELLTKSKKVAEVSPKKGTKNQKPFVKMFIMQLDNIKMTVGLQKSTGDKVQYCTLSPVDFWSPTVILILSSCIIYIFKNGF